MMVKYHPIIWCFIPDILPEWFAKNVISIMSIIAILLGFVLIRMRSWNPEISRLNVYLIEITKMRAGHKQLKNLAKHGVIL